VKRRGHRAADLWLVSLSAVHGFDHGTSSFVTRTPQRNSESWPVALSRGINLLLKYVKPAVLGLGGEER
jgi:hypothetical protein